MSWKGPVRIGLVLLAVLSSVVVSVRSVELPGASVILAGEDEPTRPRQP